MQPCLLFGHRLDAPPPPPPPPVHYGNVRRQKSSAGSLCGGWEQRDSCTARGHTAATATQGKKNINVTAASKLSWGADLIKEGWWRLMCHSSHPLSQLFRMPSYIFTTVMVGFFLIIIISIHNSQTSPMGFTFQVKGVKNIS